MTPYALVAASFQSRGAYEAITDSGEAALLPEEFVGVWGAIRRFYETDESARKCDPEIVTAYATETLANPKHRQHVERMVAGLVNAEVSAANIQEMLRLVSRTRVADELAQALAMRKDPEAVTALMAKYQELAADVEAEQDTELDWRAVITERLDTSGRLVVSPRALNEFLGGGVRPGHNLTIFARPEAGKTALALTMATGFARRGHKVLYVVNEDSVKDLMVRAVASITKLTTQQIEQDVDAALRLGLARGLGHLVMRELAPGSLRELELLCKQHRPQVLIVDQIRNLRASKTDNFVQGLDHIAQGIRAIGKTYELVTIGITQAGDSASGRPILEMGDIDSSNTGIPGAADVLIGMGVTDTLRNAGQRVLSVSKNKLSGQHGHFTVRIDEARSLIQSQ